MLLIVIENSWDEEDFRERSRAWENCCKVIWCLIAIVVPTVDVVAPAKTIDAWKLPRKWRNLHDAGHRVDSSRPRIGRDVEVAVQERLCGTGSFGARKRLELESDTGLLEFLRRGAGLPLRAGNGLPALDHAAFVPLWFLSKRRKIFASFISRPVSRDGD